ncbi:MAG: hypothetical protein MJY43_03290 [Bacteroidales bacterium]|nr:hypothetical protein [Bacteroidales bacterium]
MKGDKDKLSFLLYLAYYLLLALAAVIIVRILYLQIVWQPKDKIASKLRQPVIEKVTEPVRGNILAQDGSMLAMSYPRYQIYMDCGASAKNFETKSLSLPSPVRKDSIAVWEKQWKKDAEGFAEGLAKVFNIQGKDAAYYRKTIWEGYDNEVRYMKLGRPIERAEYMELKKYPLIRDGRNKGGVWAETVPTRRYPYGSLARRTIGNTIETDERATYTGIDGKFNSVLHGEAGHEWLKYTDDGFVRDYDSTFVPAKNGKDIRTTLNIDYQEIADRNLRSMVEPDHDVEAACCVLMEVKTGAIRAMVNLSRNGSSDAMGEIENICVTRLGEPGSVFKMSTLMTMLQEGYVKSLNDWTPANGGLLDGYKYEADKHVKDYIRDYHSNRVPLWYSIMVSANQPFRYLAVKYYEDRPEEFIEKVLQYKFGEAVDLDVAEKMPQPYVPYPGKEAWSKYDLAQVAMGYAVNVTPMHILTFYNAIANRGRMMKPYLVESIEENGKEVRHLGESVLNGAICRPDVADTLMRALSYPVREKGTAPVVRNAKCSVAGKTGTSRISMGGKYEADGGIFRNQGTFCGIFPAEDPQYTIICCVYSRPTRKSFYGSGIPAGAVTKIINEIYNIDPYWNETVTDNRK